MIDDKDVIVMPYPPRVVGGQQVGRTTFGVSIEHIPSGLIAIAVSARSQHRNRQIAMDMILGGLTSGSYLG